MNKHYTNYSVDTDNKVIDFVEKYLKDNNFDRFVSLMPDAHFCEPYPVGFTVRYNKLDDYSRAEVVEIVGADIGCGVTSTMFKIGGQLDLHELLAEIEMINSNDEYGIGGGNHFIELGYNEVLDTYLLTCHSGSRGIGGAIYKRYHKISDNYKVVSYEEYSERVKELVELAKATGNKEQIPRTIKMLKNWKNKTNGKLGLRAEYFSDYLEEMNKAVYFAKAHRLALLNQIIDYIWTKVKVGNIVFYNNTHNYYETERQIVRKGAIRSDECAVSVVNSLFCNDDLDKGVVITPLSMGEGVMISTGNPREDNNFSAMHGAGRLLSRTEAKKVVELDKFRAEMKDVVTGDLEDFVDEAPEAYKPLTQIAETLTKVAEPRCVFRPILNFKTK